MTSPADKPMRNPFKPERYADETQVEYRQRLRLAKRLAKRVYPMRKPALNPTIV